jgi:hypothetical protein
MTGLVLLHAAAALGSPDETPAGVEGGLHVVHRFDFDERVDNPEPLPRYWEPFRPPGFPKYTLEQSGFDRGMGHTEPPALFLDSRGRDVAFLYRGPETPVRAGTTYRVEAFIRGRDLEHARARLSALYIDIHGDPLLDTLVSSRYVGGPMDREQWNPVVLSLQAAPPNARSIGLVAWVVQEGTWEAGPSPHRSIPLQDVRAGAWFDDIGIHAMQIRRLTTSNAGNVLPPDGPQDVLIILSDDEDDTLTGTLTIRDEHGGEVLRQAIASVLSSDLAPQHVAVGHLPPGMYEATLDTGSASLLAPALSLRFAVLAPRVDRSRFGARAGAFGVVVDPRERGSPDAELQLLLHQSVRSVKLPIWAGETDELPTLERLERSELMLRALLREGIELTGVFGGPPSALAQSPQFRQRSLSEFIAEDATAWRDPLTETLAPYAGFFRAWQLGADGDEEVASDPFLAAALTRIRGEMATLIHMPVIRAPVVSQVLPAASPLPADGVCVALSPHLRPAEFPDVLRSHETAGTPFTSAYIVPLDAGSYRADARLADYARRILMARSGGADTVFVPPTWRTQARADGPVTEPTMEYLVLRTIAQVLGDREPGGEVRTGSEAVVLVFFDDQSAALALWDPAAPAEGRMMALQCGSAERVIDLRGRATLLTKDARGRHLIPISPMPVLVPGVERWLVELRQSVRLTPDRVSFSNPPAGLLVEMRNTSAVHLLGQVELIAPESWELRPPSSRFDLAPYDRHASMHQLRYPHVASAGMREIIARVELTHPAYAFDVPLAVELHEPDIQVSGLPIIDGADVILRHVVKNVSNTRLHFRGTANVPGRTLLYHPFTNLDPGESMMAEYRFSGAASLSGRGVRLMLRELNDGPRIHNLELTIP